MGISDRKRSIESPVNINLDLNQEPKPNQFLIENNIKSGDFVSRKKSGNIFAGSKLNVEGQGIYNVKVFKNEILKKLPIVSPGVDGLVPTPTPTPSITASNTPTPTPTPSITATNTPTPTVTPTPTTVFQFTNQNLSGIGGPDFFYLTDYIDNTTSSYLYGFFTGYTYNNTLVNYIIKLNQDLTVDYSFTGGTQFNISPWPFAFNSITQQSDGKLIVTGTFTQYSGVSRNRIIRLNTDGTIDNTFTIGTGFNSFTEGTAVDSLGRIVVVGFFSSYSGTSAPRIVRLNSNGSYDSTFVVGTGLNNTGVEVLMNSDDSMFISGYFSSYNGTSTPNHITKLLSNGTIDTSFSGGSGFNTVSNQPNGLMRVSGETSFYAFGYFTTYSGVSANRIIKLNIDGTIDNSFNSGTGFDNIVNYGYVIWNNKLLFNGLFTSYNGVSSNGTIILNLDGTVYQTFTNSYPTVFSIGSKLYGQPLNQPIELLATYP